MENRIDTDRRSILLGAVSAVALAACSPKAALAASPSEAAFKDSPFRKMSDGEWRQRLTPKAYGILRHEDTEYAGTGPFLDEHRKGVFHCAGCDLALFKSEWKFESGTGWPSFFDKIKENIGEKRDADGDRTEYHCARCLGHQGHVFNDGPKPTGLRYCNNGYALSFKPAAGAAAPAKKAK